MSFWTLHHKNVSFKPAIQSYKPLYKSNAEIDQCQLQIKRFHLVYQSILGNLWNVLKRVVSTASSATSRCCLNVAWMSHRWQC